MTYYEIIEQCEQGAMNASLAAQALEAIGIDPCDVAGEIEQACELAELMHRCESEANIYASAYEE